MMKLALRVVLIAGTCLAASSPGAADEHPNPSLVKVLACEVDAQSSALTPSSPGFGLTHDSLLHIAFVNRAPRTLRDVTFRVGSGEGTRTIGQVGAFASGEVARQTYGPFADLGRDPRCEVASATFDEAAAVLSEAHTIIGLICAVHGKYGLNVRTGRDRVETVSLHRGTIINPTGLQLFPGMLVVIGGRSNGTSFDADTIDAPVELANRMSRNADGSIRIPVGIPTGTFQTNGPSAEGGG